MCEDSKPCPEATGTDTTEAPPINGLDAIRILAKDLREKHEEVARFLETFADTGKVMHEEYPTPSAIALVMLVGLTALIDSFDGPTFEGAIKAATITRLALMAFSLERGKRDSAAN